MKDISEDHLEISLLNETLEFYLEIKSKVEAGN